MLDLTTATCHQCVLRGKLLLFSLEFFKVRNNEVEGAPSFEMGRFFFRTLGISTHPVL